MNPSLWPCACRLAARLSGLEQKLGHLDDGSLAVLQETAGGWLGALQAADGEESADGSGGSGSSGGQGQQQNGRSL